MGKLPRSFPLKKTINKINYHICSLYILGIILHLTKWLINLCCNERSIIINDVRIIFRTLQANSMISMSCIKDMLKAQLVIGRSLAFHLTTEGMAEHFWLRFAMITGVENNAAKIVFLMNTVSILFAQLPSDKQQRVLKILKEVVKLR